MMAASSGHHFEWKPWKPTGRGSHVVATSGVSRPSLHYHLSLHPQQESPFGGHSKPSLEEKWDFKAQSAFLVSSRHTILSVIMPLGS